MKKTIKMVMAVLVSAALSQTASAAGTTPPSGNDLALVKMIETAVNSSVRVQEAVKDYLYAGNDIETTRATRAMQKSLTQFDASQKELSSAFTDAKHKNLMAFIRMNADELKELVGQPYSLENAQEVIDLGEAIAEGERKLASVFRAKLSKDYPVAKGQRYDIVQIAKYYMAYQAGIKDANTIRQMKKTVAGLDQLLKKSKAYPNNTVEMNQVVNSMDKLWQTVKQFYLDIEEGGLPIIVYQTSDKLDKSIVKYSKLLTASIGKK